MGSTGPTTTPYFQSGYVNLPYHEVDDIEIAVATKRYAVSFDLVVHYLIGDQKRTMVINNHGVPFQVTAFRCGGSAQLSYDQVLAPDSPSSIPRWGPASNLNGEGLC